MAKGESVVKRCGPQFSVELSIEDVVGRKNRSRFHVIKIPKDGINVHYELFSHASLP